tara:strand:+ start:1619 stop:2683 length:1065 start_codon:yes stop_codon:yes gene_type:complete
MKVAVIGGGFYGIMAALEASKNKVVKEVTIFEKNKSLMQASGKFNQARLHLGFHYPRSEETINQSKIGFSLYKKRFPNATKSIKKNIYLIREDGLLGIDEYLRIMKKNKIKFKNIDIKDTAFKYKSNDIEFKTIQVNERYIDIVKLNQNLFREIKEIGINVCLNHEVKNINTIKGELECHSGYKGRYDLIVNCSYTSPFIGFSEYKVPLKYEFCNLLLIRSDEISNQAITIMDGQFVSIYPWLSKMHSVSSVKFTPSIKTNNFSDLQSQLKKRKMFENEKTNSLIEDHMRSFFDFRYDLLGSFSTVKVKLREDKGDQRLVKTFSEGKCIAVLQGKLDAIQVFLNDLSDRINQLK